MFVIKTRSMGSRIALKGLGLGSRSRPNSSSLDWTTCKGDYLLLSYEEAESVIQFIIDVIDYELEDDLYISEV